MTRFYALFDDDGIPTLFWTDDIRDPDGNPAEAIEITAEQSAEFLNHQGLRRWQDGEVVPIAPAAPNVDALRSAMLIAIDTEAERQRLRWITPGTGQAMTYSRKVEEARRLASEEDPQPDAFPMLAASIGIDGADLAAVAATILAMDAAWGQIGGAIEARRLIMKRDVGLATTAAELSLVDVSAGWPG